MLPRALEVAREMAGFPAEVYERTKRGLRNGALETMRASADADPLLNG